MEHEINFSDVLQLVSIGFLDLLEVRNYYFLHVGPDFKSVLDLRHFDFFLRLWWEFEGWGGQVFPFVELGLDIVQEFGSQ